MVLDLFSTYGWIVPLKDKKGETVTKAFKTIFKEGRKPQYLWTDKGKEYYNKYLKELLKKDNITLYSIENEEKSSVCERWNRTIKTKMWKQFTVQGNTVYLDILPKILKQYNNTKHSSIKMAPAEASKKKNQSAVYFNLYGNMEQLSSKPKFKVDDKVRISNYKRRCLTKATHLIGLKRYSWSIKFIHKSNHLQIKGSQQRGTTRELLWTGITKGNPRYIPHW